MPILTSAPSTLDNYITLGLVAVLVLVVVIAVIRKAIKLKKAASAPVEEEPLPVTELVTAPGTAGQIKLHNVAPQTAAMLMAIVADKLGKPLNELRFISIKEVE